MKRICAILCAVVIAPIALGPKTFAAGAPAPPALKILFVGSDPEKVELTFYEKAGSGASESRLLALKKARTPSFEKLLRQYFKTVKVVYAADYHEPMSADYNVTIFDALPTAIRKQVYEQDPITGETKRYEPAQYLTVKFVDAALMISEVTPRIAEPLGYKLDWLCLCLDSHAHGMKLAHPVFNTPYPVKPTLEYRTTPAHYRQYYSGRNLPDTLTVWRVQTEGYLNGNGFPPGLVSSGPGFTDASDAEVISNGICDKDIDSVALGRHGNVFHWGFSADPEEMTPEARRVFVNAIYYIAKYKGHHPFSHRPYRSYTRAVALDEAYRLKDSNYEKWVQEQREEHESHRAYMRKLRSLGQELTPAELKEIDEAMPVLPDREHWLKGEVLRYQPESVVAAFGTDLTQYLPYYEANLEYLRPGAKPYTFEVDEDVRSLAMSNRKLELIELCVGMLDSHLDTAKANRILTRYTGQNFKSAQEWREWLARNRSKLYFSDEDGFKFHVAS